MKPICACLIAFGNSRQPALVYPRPLPRHLHLPALLTTRRGSDIAIHCARRIYFDPHRSDQGRGRERNSFANASERSRIKPPPITEPCGQYPQSIAGTRKFRRLVCRNLCAYIRGRTISRYLACHRRPVCIRRRSSSGFRHSTFPYIRKRGRVGRGCYRHPFWAGSNVVRDERSPNSRRVLPVRRGTDCSNGGNAGFPSHPARGRESGAMSRLLQFHDALRGPLGGVLLGHRGNPEQHNLRPAWPLRSQPKCAA